MLVKIFWDLLALLLTKSVYKKDLKSYHSTFIFRKLRSIREASKMRGTKGETTECLQMSSAIVIGDR